MTAKLKPLSVSSFALGMNTRLADFNLKRKTAPFGTYMREIVNADITEDGTLKRRRGYARVLTATVGGSLWADDNQAYYASGGSLVRLTDPAGTLIATTVSGASLSSGAAVSFASAPMGGAYWSDGVSLGYTESGVSGPVAPPQPVAFPVITQGSGSLDAGTYHVAYTNLDSEGRESSAYGPVAVTVADAGSLIFSLGSLPASATLNVYVSQPNGVTMYRMLQFIGTGAQTVSSMASQGPACTTVGLENMPAGRHVRYSLGRLLVAVDTLLFYSKPYMSGLFDPTSDFIQFPAAITVVEVIEGEGVFVVADKTYWLAGDLASTKLVTVAPVGGVMGSGCSRTDSNQCAWMSTRGIMLGSAGGKVAPLQEETVAVAATASGASMLTERDGTSQIMSTLYGSALVARAEGTNYTSAEFADEVGSGETWLVNPLNNATRRYLNYAFTGYAVIAGRCYGVRANGVYLLEGETDAGTDILSTISPGRQSFGSAMIKRMESAYMMVSSVEHMKLTILDDQGSSYTYDSRRDAETMQNQRIDVGRGLSGNYLNFKITNDEGGDFELAGFELVAVETTRRIK